VERSGGFIAEREKEREREREKDSAGRLRDDIVREGFFRRVFPGRLFFSLSRVRRDKPPPDVRGGEGVGASTRRKWARQKREIKQKTDKQPTQD